MKLSIDSIKRNKLKFGLGLVAIIAIVLFIRNSENGDIETAKAELETVETVSVSDFSTGVDGSFTPTASGNAFVVRAESGGLVNKTTESGIEVKKGEVLATLENSSQLASLTQAEGIYEAAQASAGQSNFSVESQTETLNSSYDSGRSTLRTAAVSLQNVKENTLDSYFSGSTKTTLQLDDYFWDKTTLGYALSDWNVDNVSNGQIVVQIDAGINLAEQTLSLLDTIYSNVLDKENGATASQKTVFSTYKTDITSSKTTVNATLTNLKNAKSSINNNLSALKRIESSSIGGNLSTAEASVKQARGTLEAARAAYNKTIIKAPFDGKVISLNVNSGDIINVGTDIAIIEPASDAETEKSFNLPLSAVKYKPTGAYVFMVNQDNVVEGKEIKTSLVTNSYINVTGLSGDENIINDIRGLKVGDKVNSK